MKKLLLIGSVLSLSACGETVFNAAPSLFPPITGAQTVPNRAQGHFQNRPDDFVRQLTFDEQAIWNDLTDAQRARAVEYIRAGGTLRSSLLPD